MLTVDRVTDCMQTLMSVAWVVTIVNMVSTARTNRDHSDVQVMILLCASLTNRSLSVSSLMLLVVLLYWRLMVT